MQLGKINAVVDGKQVTYKEAMQVVKYCYKHRKEYASKEEVEKAMISFIRKLRGDKNA